MFMIVKQTPFEKVNSKQIIHKQNQLRYRALNHNLTSQMGFRSWKGVYLHKFKFD